MLQAECRAPALMLLAAMLFGCTTIEQARWERLQRDLDAARQSCVAAGISDGTAEFAQCVETELTGNVRDCKPSLSHRKAAQEAGPERPGLSLKWTNQRLRKIRQRGKPYSHRGKDDIAVVHSRPQTANDRPALVNVRLTPSSA